jgi:hypothetical protein
MTGAPIRGAIGDSAARTYEIGFDGDVVDVVRRVLPTAQVLSTPTCTVLWHHLRDAQELDTLLDSLLTMGITPVEMYEAAGGVRRGQAHTSPLAEVRRWGGWAGAVPATWTYCEVRVDGRLGDAILRHLRWSHRVAQTTVVRVRAYPEALRGMLAELAVAARLDYVVAV